MADVFDQLEVILREHIHMPVRDLRLESGAGADPAWFLMDSGMDAVTVGGRRSDGTAGYEASYRIKIQGGGMMEGGRWTGGTVGGIGASDHLPISNAADELYPDPRQAPDTKHQQINLLLKKLTGLYRLNVEQIYARLIAEPLEDVTMDVTEDIATLYRTLLLSYFYGNGIGTLAQINGGTLTISSTSGEGTAITIDNGTPLRFVKGQRYAFRDDGGANDATTAIVWRNGATSGTIGIARCVDHDMVTRTVFFEPEAGVGNIVVEDNDHIVLYNTLTMTTGTPNATTLVPNGVMSLLLDSGTFPGTSLSVASYQHLRSFVQGSDSAMVDPSPDVIAEIMDLISETGKPMPRDLIAEQSIWTRYGQLERATGALYVVPQGAQFQPSGGYTAPTLGHFDASGTVMFNRHTSAMVRQNMILGLSRESFIKFMPGGNKTIHWRRTRSGVSGTQGIFREVTVGSQLSKLLSAEFDVWGEFGCIDPRRNFRYIGLNNARNV